jgi:hypothetical protein
MKDTVTVKFSQDQFHAVTAAVMLASVNGIPIKELGIAMLMIVTTPEHNLIINDLSAKEELLAELEKLKEERKQHG